MLKGIFFFRAFFRPAQVRHQHAASAIVQDFFQGRDGGTDAVVIRYVKTFIERHVEVNPNEGTFSGKIDVVDGFHEAKISNWVKSFNEECGLMKDRAMQF